VEVECGGLFDKPVHLLSPVSRFTGCDSLVDVVGAELQQAGSSEVYLDVLKSASIKKTELTNSYREGADAPEHIRAASFQASTFPEILLELFLPLGAD
jgi:hypothetical protein